MLQPVNIEHWGGCWTLMAVSRVGRKTQGQATDLRASWWMLREPVCSELVMVPAPRRPRGPTPPRPRPPPTLLPSPVKRSMMRRSTCNAREAILHPRGNFDVNVIII